MAERYLKTEFKDRERVKALGARWDAEVKKWFVPHGRDLTPFAAWLPAESGAALAAVDGSAEQHPLATDKGISLSALLAGVANAVARAFAAAVWTRVEVQKADVRRGHLYLELAERTAAGEPLAQARGLVWEATANDIVPAFERTTGIAIGPGIKLLVRAKPTMHPMYGLSLVIDAIDPQYTLGDLEARRREIRARLQRESLFERNRRLPTPSDFELVLVVAPLGAAGLGDFRTEAERLERHGVCRFVYVHSRFQGEGAAAEVRAVMLEALGRLDGAGTSPDALVVIRGGGAVNDLAWLDDYELARAVCEAGVPVYTGIGHERDRVVLDEVAHTAFDTPSKVIHAIEQAIARRASQARADFDYIVAIAHRLAQGALQGATQADAAVRAGAQRQLALARQRSEQCMTHVRVESARHVRTAQRTVERDMATVRERSLAQVSELRQSIVGWRAEVWSEARQTVQAAVHASAMAWGQVAERAKGWTGLARRNISTDLEGVGRDAKRIVTDAAARSEALLREVSGQGPQKTLERGFAIVRDAQGRPITSALAASPDASISIELKDGSIAARTGSVAERGGL